MAASERKVVEQVTENGKKREETSGRMKDLKECRITNVCTYEKRPLKQSCPSACMDVIRK
jgi:hypothetical protein